MTTRLLALAVVPGFFAFGSTAYAQAPGETYYAQPPSETAPVAPVVVAPSRRNPMAQRWAIGLQLGGMGVSAEDAPDDAEETEFHTAELNVRFRATRRLEIFLAFTGGRQSVEDMYGEETEGDLAMDMVTLGARFNFRPAHRWNWYLMAGIGSTLIAHHETPEEVRDDLRRPHAMFGIGLERRWTNFALQAELRGISVGEREEDDFEDMPVSDGAPRDNPEVDFATSNEELGGGQFTLGASFYF